ncbi:LysR family transcriptional regulator [Bosea sp. 124]|uniref:LysR family transcriptional regulator n=1 Tax=Bosea sp. 124 TaxID=2135642 RepID=UPI000D3914DC|nr:LysR family transcriptional regulator [Bosea sp. 124]PTM42745.1 LysR family transcriptional regulator [Bosea sp. 124]
MDRMLALRTFAAVARLRSFAAAARQLRLSPTAASRAVALLEDELGTPLLLRTTRSVSLTAEGAAYLEACQSALEQLDDAARRIRGEDAEPRGRLVVTAPVVFGRMHVLPVVTRLLRAHPRLSVQLQLADRVVRLAEEGVDAAVRIGELADSALHQVKLAQVRRILVASPAYLAARGEPTDVAGLAGHDLIAFDTFTANGEWRFTASGRPAARVEARLITNSVETAIDAATAGLGICRVLSYQVRRDLADGRLRRILQDFEPPALPVSLIFPANRRGSPNVGAFIKAAQEELRLAEMG